MSLSGPVLQVGNAAVWQTSGRRWFSAGRPACPDAGLDLETDAKPLPSLTADYQGAAYKVVADSPEFIKLLAVTVGNIMAEVPDDEPVDKDSDRRDHRWLWPPRRIRLTCIAQWLPYAA